MSIIKNMQTNEWKNEIDGKNICNACQDAGEPAWCVCPILCMRRGSGRVQFIHFHLRYFWSYLLINFENQFANMGHWLEYVQWNNVRKHHLNLKSVMAGHSVRPQRHGNCIDMAYHRRESYQKQIHARCIAKHWRQIDIIYCIAIDQIRFGGGHNDGSCRCARYDRHPQYSMNIIRINK